MGAEAKLNLIGKRYGRLTVLYEVGHIKGKVAWMCKCDCGNEKVVTTFNLQRGATRSCGCLRDEMVKNQAQMYPKDVRIKRLRHIWHGMLRRCRETDNVRHRRYAARGISVCPEWEDYVTFARWALQNGYKDGLTIDRINIDGNYEPSNCRWITEKEQHYNTSRNRYATIGGVTKTITEWAEEYGQAPNTVFTRMARGMSLIDALNKRTHRKGGHGIPIRCVDTGEVFPSCTAAAAKYHANTSCIAKAARLNKISHGVKWEQVYD